jgi:hypothetical protein
VTVPRGIERGVNCEGIFTGTARHCGTSSALFLYYMEHTAMEHSHAYYSTRNDDSSRDSCFAPVILVSSSCRIQSKADTGQVAVHSVVDLRLYTFPNPRFQVTSVTETSPYQK